MNDSPRLVGRRRLLHGGAALGGAAAVTGMSAAWAADHAAPAPAVHDAAAAPVAAVSDEVVPFFGLHQAGVETPAPDHAAFIGVDLLDRRDRDALRRLMRILSDDAERLMSKRPALADLEPEIAVHPRGLTVTFGFGPELAAALGGEAAAAGLNPLPSFAQIDRLQPAWGQTDLLIQVRAADPLVLGHARLLLARDTRTIGKVRWTQTGFRGGPTTEAGTGRNLMGQVDGTINPALGSDDFSRLVWMGDADPGPTGATMMVLRRIQMHLDTWERVDRTGREFTIGRRLGDGAPLTGEHELDPLDLDKLDDNGFPVIDLAAHVRRAHPTNAHERFLRAPYNYLHEAADGTVEAGLLFAAYAADLERQFVPVQRRIAESDRLNTWVTPIGSAVYLLPPGCKPGGYVSDALIGEDG